MKGRAPNIPSTPQVEQRQLTALLYLLSEKKQWEPLVDGFVTLILEWVGGGQDGSGAASSGQLNLYYLKNQEKVRFTSSLECIQNVKKKDTFVRWNHKGKVFGVRFNKNEITQEFVDALLASSEKPEGPKTKCLNIQFGSNSITYNATPKQKLADVLENIVSSTKSLKSTPTNSFCLKYRGGDEKMNVDLIVENLKSCDLEIYQVKREESKSPVAKKMITLNTADPLWQTLLEMANLSIDEVMSPQVASVIESYVSEHGGMSYLRQVNDLKMSPQLADELNTLAGQVHAIQAQSSSSADDTTNSITQSQSGMTTLERKKRRAPKPPATPVVTTDSTNQVELNDDQKKLETSASKSSMKRKAPTPPTDKAPPPPSDKAPPRFVPPPPPMEPPPEDKFASPVGPLSPKSMDLVCEVTEVKDDGKVELNDEENMVAVGVDDGGQSTDAQCVITDEVDELRDESFTEERLLEEDLQLPAYPTCETTAATTQNRHQHNEHEIIDLHRAKLDMVVTEMDDDDVCYPTPSSPEVTRVVVEEGTEKEEENGITEEVSGTVTCSEGHDDSSQKEFAMKNDSELEEFDMNEDVEYVPTYLQQQSKIVEHFDPSQEERHEDVRPHDHEQTAVMDQVSHRQQVRFEGTIDVLPLEQQDPVNGRFEPVILASQGEKGGFGRAHEERTESSDGEEPVHSLQSNIIRETPAGNAAPIGVEQVEDTLVGSEPGQLDLVDSVPATTTTTTTVINKKYENNFREETKQTKVEPPTNQPTERKGSSNPPTGLYAKLKARTMQMSNSKLNEENTKKPQTAASTPSPSIYKKLLSERNIPQTLSNPSHPEASKHQQQQQQQQQKQKNAPPPVAKKPPPPLVKPKPKRPPADFKQQQQSNTFSRDVDEIAGSRETIRTKNIGSLQFGFAQDRKTVPAIVETGGGSHASSDVINTEQGLKPSQLFTASKPSSAVINNMEVDIRATNL